MQEKDTVLKENSDLLTGLKSASENYNSVITSLQNGIFPLAYQQSALASMNYIQALKKGIDEKIQSLQQDSNQKNPKS